MGTPVNPHVAPSYHEAAMAYLYAHPGCSYDQAVIATTGNQPGQCVDGDEPASYSQGIDPHQAPANFDEVMDLVRTRRVSYEQAERLVNADRQKAGKPAPRTIDETPARYSAEDKAALAHMQANPGVQYADAKRKVMKYTPREVELFEKMYRFITKEKGVPLS